MKTKTVRMSFVLLAALLLAAGWTLVSSSMSWADGRGYGHARHPDAASFIWHILHAKETLGLTDEQVTHLQTIKTTYKKDRVKKQAEVDLAKIEVHDLLHTDQKASTNIEEAVRKVYALKADLRIASIKAFQEARTVLRPEQLQKMKELREKERGSMESKRSEHGGDRHHDEG
jgi:Spy/CpxP family protein refolding chaperone